MTTPIASPAAPPTGRPAIELENVTKRFGEGETAVVAVNHVTVRVEPAQVLLIMGPSGSGKTTLLSLMGALLRPTEGTIRLDGVELSALSERQLPAIRLERFGFIFQDFNLLSALTVLENVSLVAELTGEQARQARVRAAALLTDLGLEKRLAFLPEQLSGGEKQRVAIARSLINEPTVLLADEPTANLDSRIGHEITGLLRDIARGQGRSVVIVSHDDRIRDIADRVLWLEDGRIRDLEALAVDPICGMAVDREKGVRLERGGTVYWFCSNGCRSEFRGNHRLLVRGWRRLAARKSLP
jgi:putative ABC transport system ATP-binding protein